MLVPPFISFDAIGREELNSCLVAWGHKMGPWHRPNYGCEVFHGLCHNGELVAVTAAARMIPEATAGLSRDEAFELGRVCAARRDLNRATLRLWREFVFPAFCKAHGWKWVISYQDAALHPGFPRWIGPAGPKAAETLAKLAIPSFTRRVRQDSAT